MPCFGRRGILSKYLYPVSMEQHRISVKPEQVNNSPAASGPARLFYAIRMREDQSTVFSLLIIVIPVNNSLNAYTGGQHGFCCGMILCLNLIINILPAIMCWNTETSTEEATNVQPRGYKGRMERAFKGAEVKFRLTFS